LAFFPRNVTFVSFGYERTAEKQIERVKAHRNEECKIRRNYLNTAFTDLILELQGELNDLQQTSLLGEQNTLERERLEGRIEDLKKIVSTFSISSP
jgi:hypothetical protein